MRGTDAVGIGQQVVPVHDAGQVISSCAIFDEAAEQQRAHGRAGIARRSTMPTSSSVSTK